MKMSNDIPSPETYSTMKSPLVSSSPIPSLIDMDPFAPLEFHFPCQDLSWDFSDLRSSEPEDYNLDSDLDVSFNSSFYHFLHDPDDEDDMNDEENNMKIKEDEVEDDLKDIENNMINNVKDEDVFVSKLFSTISEIAPNFVYKRRKYSMKRKRNRRKRKRISAENVDPELRSIWLNSVGDLFAPSALSEPSPPSTLPKVNLSSVNKSMLNRLPDVIDAPIHSCSETEEFYTKVVCQFYATKYVRTPTPQTQHQVPKPFGSIPGIETDFGIIPPPEEAIYGYVYSDGKWRVKAEYPRVPDPGGGRGLGRGGEEGRGGRGVREVGHKGCRQKMCERQNK